MLSPEEPGLSYEQKDRGFESSMILANKDSISLFTEKKTF